MLNDISTGSDNASGPNTPALTVAGISKRFGSSIVLDDVGFTVSNEEILVLLGASGSGKTTILRIIAGLEQPDTGTVHLHGKNVTSLPARERSTGVIFQNYALFPKMTVEQNVGYGLIIRNRSRSEIDAKVDELLELVQLQEHRGKFPSQLSGGQQQRVAIARALAYDPEILLFDEPFAALDAQTRAALREDIRELLKSLKVPSVFITHDQEEALELGDRIGVLNAGRLEQIDSPERIYNEPSSEQVAAFVGDANIVEGSAGDGCIVVGKATLEIPAGVSLVSGRPVKVLLRPEDIILSRPETADPKRKRLGTGTVEKVSFVGAYERITVETDLPTRQRMTVTRPQTDAERLPLRPGDLVSVSVDRFRLVEPP